MKQLSIIIILLLSILSGCIRSKMNTQLDLIESTVAKESFVQEDHSKITNNIAEIFYDWSSDKENPEYKEILTGLILERVKPGQDDLNSYLYAMLENIGAKARMPLQERLRIEIYEVARKTKEFRYPYIENYSGYIKLIADSLSIQQENLPALIYNFLSVSQNPNANFFITNRNVNQRVNLHRVAKGIATYLLLRLNKTNVSRKLVKDLIANKSKIAPLYGHFIILFLSDDNLALNVERLLASKNKRAYLTGAYIAERLLWHMVPASQGGQLRRNKHTLLTCRVLLKKFKQFVKNANAETDKELFVASLEMAFSKRKKLSAQKKKSKGERKWLEIFQSIQFDFNQRLYPRNALFSKKWQRIKNEEPANSRDFQVFYNFNIVISEKAAKKGEKTLPTPKSKKTLKKKN